MFRFVAPLRYVTCKPKFVVTVRVTVDDRRVASGLPADRLCPVVRSHVLLSLRLRCVVIHYQLTITMIIYSDKTHELAIGLRCRLGYALST